MNYTLDTGRALIDAAPLSQDMDETAADGVVTVYNAFAAGEMTPLAAVTDAPTRAVSLKVARAPAGTGTIDWGDGSREAANPAVPSGTATTTSGSANLTLVTPTTGWQNGMPVSGTGIPAGTTIASGAGTATMVMSANATASASAVAITGARGTSATHTYAYDGPFQISYSVAPTYTAGQFKTPPAIQTVSTEIRVNWPPKGGGDPDDALTATEMAARPPH